MKNAKGFKTDIVCPDCGGVLVVREGYSKFLGCINYPNCKNKMGWTTNPAIQFSTKIFNVPSAIIRAAFDQNLDNFDNDMDDYPMGIYCSDDITSN